MLVASLGYFVDIYDLVLFNVVKKEKLAGYFRTAIRWKSLITMMTPLAIRWWEC